MNEAKSKNLFIHMSEKEKNIIVQNAKKCGLSYIRWPFLRRPFLKL